MHYGRAGNFLGRSYCLHVANTLMYPLTANFQTPWRPQFSSYTSTLTTTGENDEDEIAYRDEIFKEVTLLEKKDKITNQFHFIERATQTKNNDTIETESQTDPPPMYSQGGFWAFIDLISVI